jgi:hypothetical protein
LAGSILRHITLTAKAGALTLAGVAVGVRTGFGLVYYKAVEGVLNLTGILSPHRIVLRALSGVVTLAGVIGLKLGVNISGALVLAGLITRKLVGFGLALVGQLISAGVVTRNVSKITAGILTLSGVLKKALTLSAYTGTLALAGVAVAGVGKLVAGALTAAGAITIKNVKHGLAGGFALAGAVLKRASITRAGTLTLAGAVVAYKRAVEALAGVLPLAGEGGSFTVKKLMVGVLTLAGTIRRALVVLLDGYLTLAGVSVPLAKKVLLGTLTLAGAATRVVGRLLDGYLTLAGVVIKRVSFWVSTHAGVPSGILGMAGTLVRKPGKVLAAGLTLAGVAVKTTKLLYSGAVTLTGVAVPPVAYS